MKYAMEKGCVGVMLGFISAPENNEFTHAPQITTSFANMIALQFVEGV